MPWSASLTGYGGQEAWEPATTNEYSQTILQDHAAQTKKILLEDSTWLHDPETYPHPMDLCDGLITSIHDALAVWWGTPDRTSCPCRRLCPFYCESS